MLKYLQKPSYTRRTTLTLQLINSHVRDVLTITQPRYIDHLTEYHVHSANGIFVNCSWVATQWQQYSTNLHTNNTQTDTKQTIHRTTQKFGRMRAVFHLFGFYPGICLTTEVKARRTLSHIGNINSSKPRKELRAAHGPQRRSKQLLYSRRGCACAHTVRCVPRYSAASEHVTILPVAYQARGGVFKPPPPKF